MYKNISDQVKANKRFADKHPYEASYATARRQARGFVSPKSGTKLDRAIKEQTKYDYHQDLLDLKQLIEEKLKEV